MRFVGYPGFSKAAFDVKSPVCLGMVFECVLQVESRAEGLQASLRSCCTLQDVLGAAGLSLGTRDGISSPERGPTFRNPLPSLNSILYCFDTLWVWAPCWVINQARCQSNDSPVTQSRCRMTASLRATATRALPWPFFFARRTPQRLSAQERLERVSST